jgi:hypothetical protein
VIIIQEVKKEEKMHKKVFILPLVFVVVFFFQSCEIRFVPEVCSIHGFCCKGRIDEYEKGDKEIIIQKSKGNKEKCKKRLIFTFV